jgi:sulfate/thiosulfate transport system ATP-binding protein
MSVTVSVKNLEKNFGHYPALRSVSLNVEAGELVALLGPSGSGKTTLLRAIAGLEEIDTGEVFFGDINANQLTLRDRRIGFVFQQYALFRHMTVMNNIAFGLRARPRSTRPAKAAIRSRVLELLNLVHLDGLEGRYPAQLSGGQRQRVALARALAIEPRVLLLDEPFGALDAKVRKDLRRWLRELHDRTGHTTLFVTHDQEEAFELADRVAILNTGRIEQVGSPSQIVNHPMTDFVAEFVDGIDLKRVATGMRSPVAPQAHNLKVVSSNLAPATK